MGMYNLVYKDKKELYFLSLSSVFTSVLLLILSIFFAFAHIPSLEKFFSFSCLLICFCGLLLIKYIDKITTEKHLVVQDVRFKLLKKYYSDNDYNYDDIIIINQQLEKRIEKIGKQKITILVIISVLILPLWDILIQNYFDDFTSIKILKFVIFLIIFSFATLVVIRFFNKALYLYEENFYIKNNVSIIENLIYLNGYIIRTKEGKNTHRKRK